MLEISLIRIITLILLLCVAGNGAAQVDAPLPIPAPPGLAASSYLLVDHHTGRVIAEKDADLRLEPASLTKMMTAYIVSFQLKRGDISADDLVPVSRNAHAAIGSRTFLEPGSQVTVRDLMYGLVVQSGNDASVALAEHIGGSEEGFATMMNEMARRLGMANTHFVNATGLPAPDHYSTARDMAKLATAVIRDHPSHYRLYSVKEFEYNGIKQKNRNTLLLRDQSVDGIKTGHTEAAGYCLVASARRGDMRLISVLMGARNEQQRSTESMRILNYGFRFYETIKLSETNTRLGDVQVWGGRQDMVPMAVAEERFVTLQSGQKSALQREIDVSANLVAPISAGQSLGVVKYKLDEQVIAEVPLVALESVERGSFFTRTADSIKRMMR
jgi:D-alanyl-D-alanine carboxypeptidase (penicillin-binding protein 5/6)